MPPRSVLVFLFVSIGIALAVALLGRRRTHANSAMNTPVARWRSFGCGLALALGVLLVLLGLFLVFAVGSFSGCRAGPNLC